MYAYIICCYVEQALGKLPDCHKRLKAFLQSVSCSHVHATMYHIDVSYRQCCMSNMMFAWGYVYISLEIHVQYCTSVIFPQTHKDTHHIGKVQMFVVVDVVCMVMISMKAKMELKED